MLMSSISALPAENQSSNPSQQSPQAFGQHHPENQQKTKQEPNAHQGQKTIRVGKKLVDVEGEINSGNREK